MTWTSQSRKAISQPGQRVLDVASGVGEPAIAIAEKVGPAGSVIGADLVQEMVTFARQHAAARGVKNVEFRRVDGEELDVPPGSFDVVTSRWGLMFMPDPTAFLAKARTALKPGGRIILTCWAAPQKNPWLAIPIAVLARHTGTPPPPPGTPGIFAFADGARLRSVVEGAGFSIVQLDELTLRIVDFDTGREYFEQMLDIAAPMTTLYSQLPEDERQAVAREIAAEIERAGGGRAQLDGTTWYATGQA